MQQTRRRRQQQGWRPRKVGLQEQAPRPPEEAAFSTTGLTRFRCRAWQPSLRQWWQQRTRICRTQLPAPPAAAGQAASAAAARCAARMPAAPAEAPCCSPHCRPSVSLLLEFSGCHSLRLALIHQCQADHCRADASSCGCSCPAMRAVCCMPMRSPLPTPCPSAGQPCHALPTVDQPDCGFPAITAKVKAGGGASSGLAAPFPFAVGNAAGCKHATCVPTRPLPLQTMRDLLTHGAAAFGLDDFAVVDCRYDYEFQGGHLPGGWSLLLVRCFGDGSGELVGGCGVALAGRGGLRGGHKAGWTAGLPAWAAQARLPCDPPPWPTPSPGLPPQARCTSPRPRRCLPSWRSPAPAPLLAPTTAGSAPRSSSIASSLRRGGPAPPSGSATRCGRRGGVEGPRNRQQAAPRLGAAAFQAEQRLALLPA